jgi:hypothetical protein
LVAESEWVGDMQACRRSGGFATACVSAMVYFWFITP